MLRRSISLSVLALSIGCLGSGISLTYAEKICHLRQQCQRTQNIPSRQQKIGGTGGALL
jgi:hypothetical protein